MPKHIIKEKELEIVSMYKSKPMTIKHVSIQTGVSEPSVIKVLDKYRIKRYSKAKLYSPNLVEDYFEKIDTEAKAYFLGIIITDGCIHRAKGKQPMVCITLDKEDKYIIEAFKREIKSNKNVTGDGRGCYSLQIFSTKMVNDLKKYGVHERKSLNTVLPFNIPQHLYGHLLRGIFDGDGSYSFYSRMNHGRCSHTKAVRLCQGNKQFLSDVMKMINISCGAEPVSIYKEKESLWSIRYAKNDSMYKIISLLYKDSHVYMKRKKKICDLINSEIIRYGNTEITL